MRSPRWTALAVGLCIVVATLAGCGGGDARAERPLPPGVAVEFRLAERAAGPGLTPVAAPDGGILYVAEAGGLTAADVAGVALIATPAGGDAMQFRFTTAGAAKMAALTRGNVGKTLVVLVDGRVVTAPTIQAEIGDRAVVQASPAETRRLAERFGLGAPIAAGGTGGGSGARATLANAVDSTAFDLLLVVAGMIVVALAVVALLDRRSVAKRAALAVAVAVSAALTLLALLV